MMATMNRRQFIRRTVGIGGALTLHSILAACTAPSQTTSSTSESTPTASGAIASPTVVSSLGDDPMLAPYLEAKIDWRQVEGETITVLITPANYFEKFRQVTPLVFTPLTGITVQFEVIPPRELREKALLDLGSGAATYATHTGDPMYLPLYEAQKWVDPLDIYLDDPTLTDAAWFDFDDIVENWRVANTVNGRLQGMPVEGETTIHIYRADVYEELGLELPETLDDLRQTAEAAHTDARAGIALRGFLGAGQNMYIFPSLFRMYGGEWFDSNGNPTVNSEAGVSALEYYVEVLQKYGPKGVENWNWPEIAEAFAAGNVTQYLDANSTASILENPGKSQVVGKVGYRRWPQGPTGKRITSIWNWAMPINAALPERKKKATWLYIQWLASRPAQIFSATYKENPDADMRTGVNRMSIWNDAEYRKVVSFTDDYVDVVLTSLREDTDPDWRPRVPQWPEIGDVMAIAVQSALTGQMTPKAALDDANEKIARIMKG